MALGIILAASLLLSLVLPSGGQIIQPSPLVTGAASAARIWYMQGNGLWVMNFDGSGRAQVAANLKKSPSGCATFSVSPNGRRVAYQSSDGQLVVANAQGGDVRSVATGRVGSVSWSPDSQQIVYSLNDDIYVYKVDGGGKPETLATGGGRFYFPTFAPDGRNLAFLEAPGGTLFNVIVLRATDQEWRNLGTTGASSQGVDSLCPTVVKWSPEGTRLLIDYGEPVFVFYLAGGTPTQVGGRGETASHLWDPSSSMLAFKEADNSLWLVNADGSGQRPLVAEPVGEAVWHPTGRPLITYTAFGQDRLNDLWIINVENGQKQQLTAGDTSIELGLNWTPDGNSVIFERRGAQGEAQGVWKVSTNGNDLVQLAPAGSAIQVR